MKISKNKMLKISDLVEEIKALDKLIKQHKESASIISQYEHRKLKFYNELSELKSRIFC